MSGKITTAPCGCPGRHVFGQYVECLAGCDRDVSDGVPRRVEPEHTRPICTNCGSSDVAEYTGMSAVLGKELWHCKRCLRGFMA